MHATMTGTGVGTISLDAPPLNILTETLLATIVARLEELAADPSLRVVVLRAEGRHFSAGASVEEHLPGSFETMIPAFGKAVLALYDFPLPVIAAVRGRCLGGGFELVQAADIVVAAEDALFGQPEIQLGVFPPAACALLPLRMRSSLAAELLFTGDSLTAQEALAAGLISRVVPPTALDDVADGLARRMAKHSAVALRAAKRALRAASGASVPAGVERATRIYVDELMRAGDPVEGLRAFLEKRQPEWSHR